MGLGRGDEGRAAGGTPRTGGQGEGRCCSFWPDQVWAAGGAPTGGRGQSSPSGTHLEPVHQVDGALHPHLHTHSRVLSFKVSFKLFLQARSPLTACSLLCGPKYPTFGISVTAVPPGQSGPRSASLSGAVVGAVEPEGEGAQEVWLEAEGTHLKMWPLGRTTGSMASGSFSLFSSKMAWKERHGRWSRALEKGCREHRLPIPAQQGLGSGGTPSPHVALPIPPHPPRRGSGLEGPQVLDGPFPNPPPNHSLPGTGCSQLGQLVAENPPDSLTSLKGLHSPPLCVR